jgi:sugar/nucleoside kinase (ribokinase family)
MEIAVSLTAVNAREKSGGAAGRGPPVVLCAGIAVLDFVFRVDRFPTADTKSPMREFTITGGGCAANAAIAVARLGGVARFAGPLGDDEHSARILGGLAVERVDTDGVARIPGAESSVSGIFVDAAGERLLATRRAPRLAAAYPRNPDRLLRGVEVVLADNHFPAFVTPLCEAARARGVPVVLDIDKPAEICDPLLALASHPIFSAEALRAATGIDDLAQALPAAGNFCRGFVAVTDGSNGAYWCMDMTNEPGVRRQPAFRIDAADTLAAGDVFHAGFALALAERRPESDALRFASAAAALKCTRFGGIIGSPMRAEVEELLRLGEELASPAQVAP